MSGTEVTDKSVAQGETLRMGAYYYSFQLTGCLPIDKILSEVACAGKSYHNTEDWCGPDETGLSYVDHIQMHASNAALKYKAVVDALRSAICIADEARNECDAAPCGMKAGKLLIALSGNLPGYRQDIDDIHTALKLAGAP